ncbi:glutaredoxin family protein [Thiohalomonas denitrificans]|uniref:Glutathione S-transferase, N-terminal domain n=1 Tax=Thiohalomonas denitrificans TaxID=415747 RepID=A0A1G5QX80_9GAMM|nr:glutathione S-transferase N-terminal domain-containing protein [Thiohalomonas denitrificans]SCZ66445.1 Glutathione S-transferase, N-terminal domain [Thiohalomonas denitrificans]
MRILIRLFFRTLRPFLTPVVLLVDRLAAPTPVQRPEPEQEYVDRQTRALTLYQFKTCPFCIKTRHAIRRLALNIELRNAQHDPVSREELLAGGGEVKVPCLRIVEEDGSVRWMYESSDIIDYLDGRFGTEVDLGDTRPLSNQAD